MKSKNLLRHPLAIAIFSTTLTTAVSTSVMADQVIWSGDTSSYWTDPTNWVGGAVPTAADTAEISNGVTATVDTFKTSYNVGEVFIGAEGGAGRLEISGVGTPSSDTVGFDTDNFTMGSNQLAPNSVDAALIVSNAHVRSASGLSASQDDVDGDVNFTVEFNNSIFDTNDIRQAIYIKTGSTVDLTASFIFNDSVVNSNSSLEFGGDTRTNADCFDTHVTTNTNVGIYDSTFVILSDLELGEDVKFGRNCANSSITADTQAIIERSNITASYIELATYVGQLGDEGLGNTLNSNVDLTITDSTIELLGDLRMGDVSAAGDSALKVVSTTSLTLNNVVMNIDDEILLTDAYVHNYAEGEDRAIITLNDSSITTSGPIEISSDGSTDGTGKLTLDSLITLNHSTLSTTETIQIADLAPQIDRGFMVEGANDSYVGKLTAYNSAIDAEEVIVGSGPGVATLRLNQSYLSLTDVEDGQPDDAGFLEAHEGALTLSADSLLKIDAAGYTRASADNATSGSGLYGAIDAIQVTLAGTLQINAGDDMNDEGTFDIIRAERKDGVTLGDGAFTGIQGNFDNVIVKNLPFNAKATTSIVTETIDGKTYDIYRVEVGSMSFFSFAMMMVLGGMRRFRK